MKAIYSGKTRLPRRAVVDDAAMRAALKEAKVKPTRSGAVTQDQMEMVFDAAEELGLDGLADSLGGLVSATGGFVLQPWPCRPNIELEVAA